MLLRICHKIEKRNTIRNVVIRREDLEKIIESFKVRDLPVTVSDCLSEFTDIDDIILKRGSRPHEIKIYSYSEKHGSVSVLFKTDDVRMYALGSDAIRELYHELTDLITKRRNWKKYFCKLNIWFFFHLQR